jgi:hypothetical protein
MLAVNIARLSRLEALTDVGLGIEAPDLLDLNLLPGVQQLHQLARPAARH